ncbi:hypothetical protein KP509_28G018800 [Ceratopteris richardii]|uniref:Uncharacterized protein n=1 Tax=Ceratopteris richardii TaxID=49495 RepID=A0A8T2RCN9_CERRI|nr:hypothetical protein KP509_28G018800 [Ceratopteris richardii]
MEKEQEVDAKYNLTMRSGASSKESFVSVHENFRRNVSCSSEELSVRICKAASLSTPSVSLKSLRSILIRDLMVGHRHKCQVLFGNLCVEPLKVDVSVHTIMDDDEGSTCRLCVHNAIGNVISDKHLEFLFGKGLKVAIKEPYFEMDQDGALAIIVDNPRDILRNPLEKGTGFPGRIPSTPAVSSFLLTDARNARKQGNRAFETRDWDRAVRLYTEAAKTLLELGYKSLIQSSYMPDEVRKELLITFSNRAEARLLLRHYEAAEIDARIALQLDGDHAKSLSRRGRSLRGLHRYNEAKLCFQRALTAIERNENLEMDKGLIQKSIKECSTCEQQQRTGVYNLMELLREAKSGSNPVCGEYVGPVTIGSAEDPNLGRAILVSKDVEPGELLMVSRAVAHVTFEYKIESMWKSYHDLVVSQLLPRARSSELFQKQVSSLSLSSRSSKDFSVPSTDLLTSVNK